jgi:hypothetical protein
MPVAQLHTWGLRILVIYNALGSDTGWRKIDCTYAFRYQKATDDSGVSSWTTDFDIRHSVYVAKYRVLLSEQEFPGVDNRRSFSVFIELP